MLPGFGSPLDFAAIREGVDESGFQLLSLEIELSGKLTEQPDSSGTSRSAIRVKDSGQLVWVLEGESPSEREAYADLQRRIKSNAGSASLLGRVSPESTPQPSLVLQRIWTETERD